MAAVGHRLYEIRAAREHRPSDRSTVPGTHLPSRPGLCLLNGGAVVRHCTQDLAVESEDPPLPGVAEFRRVLDEHLEQRLEIERRPADDLEDLGDGGLLRQRLGQLAVPRLELPEQTGVLERDCRLIGEGLEQLRLPVGEGPNVCSVEQDTPDWVSLS